MAENPCTDCPVLDRICNDDPDAEDACATCHSHDIKREPDEDDEGWAERQYFARFEDRGY